MSRFTQGAQGRGRMREYQQMAVSEGMVEEVYVAHIGDPDHFYIQLNKWSERLDQLMETLHARYDKMQEYIQRPALGSPCVAQFSEDKCWYRAVITGVLQSKMVEVRFIDYGNSECISLDKVKEITDELLAIPCMALHCGLTGVATTQGFWAPEHTAQFEDLVLDQSFTATFRGCKSEEGILSVELLNASGRNINKDFGASTNTACVEEMSAGSRRQVQIGQGDAEMQISVNMNSSKKQGQGEFAHICSNGDNSSLPCVELAPGQNEVVVVYAFTPGEFWCQLVANTDRLSALVSQLNQEYKDVGPRDRNITSPKPEMYCAAKFCEDNQWYRGQIKNVGRDEVEVYFIDYGNTEKIAPHLVKELKSSFKSEPAQAVKCMLSNLRNSSGSWSDAAAEEFEGLTLDKHLLAVSDGRVVEGKVPVKLKDSVESYDIAEKLAEANHGTLIKSTIPRVPAHLVRQPMYKKLDIPVPWEADVYLSWTDNPGCFWVHLSNQETELEELVAKVQELYNQGVNSVRSILPGMAVVAPYSEDQAWYRAVVQKMRGKKVDVQFVDYGNSDTVSADSLKEAVAPISGTAMQAIQCRLIGIGPQPPATEWTEDAMSVLETVTKDGAVCKFLSFQNGSYLVKLHVGGNDVGSELIAAGVAKKTQECSPEPPSSTQSSRSPPRASASSKGFSKSVSINVGQTVQAHVAHVDSIESFWCQLSETQSELDSLMENVENFYSQGNGIQLPNPQPGMACVAKFSEDLSWYRAMIQKVDKSGISVHFVDYGNSEVAPSASVCSIGSQFLAFPTQAFHCKLPVSCPSVGDDMIDKFHELVSDKELALKVLREQGQVKVVELLDSSISITDKMKENFLALQDQVQSQPSARGPATSRLDYSAPNRPTGKTEKVFVAFTDSPHQFSVHLANIDSELDLIKEKLMTAYGSGTQPPLASPKVGQPCCALYAEDDSWYRGKVISTRGSQITVQFVDYGNSDVIAAENVKPLLPNLLSPGPLALQCSLENVTPVSGTWTDDAIAFFETLTVEKEISCTFSQGNNVSLNVDGADVAKKIGEKGFGTNSSEPTYKPPNPPAQPNQAYVTHVDEQGIFYIQLSSFEDLIGEISERLQDFYNGPNAATLQNLKAGSPCVAKFTEDESWYRAIVEKIQGPNVSVRFVDFGNSDNVNKNDVKIIKEKFFSLPPLAFECKIQGMKTWNGNQKQKFTEVTQDKELTVTFLTRSQPYAVEVMLDSENIMKKLSANVTSPPRSSFGAPSTPPRRTEPAFQKKASPVKDSWAPSSPKRGFGSQPDPGERRSFGSASQKRDDSGFRSSPPRKESGGYGPSGPRRDSGGFGSSGPRKEGGGFGSSGPRKESGGFGSSGPRKEGGGFGSSGPRGDSGGFGSSSPRKEGGSFGSSRNQSSGYGSSSPRQNSSGFGSQRKGGFGSSPPSKPLPPPTLEKIPAEEQVFAKQSAPTEELRSCISHVENDNVFIQGTKYIQTIMSYSNKIKNLPTNEVLPVAGLACAALFSADNTWYRAQVTSVSGSSVSVVFVDFGNPESLNSSKLKQLSKELLAVPPMAFRCNLVNVKHLTPELTAVLAEEASDKELNVKFLSQEIPYCTQMTTQDKKDLSQLLCPSKFPEPTPPSQTLPGVVSNIATDGTFFVQLLRDQEHVKKMEEELKAIYAKGTIDNPKGLETGKPCCAKYPDDHTWQRAVVKNIDGKSIEVHFVDLGITEVVKSSFVQKLPRNYFFIPPYAYECILKDFVSWTEEQRDKFISVTDGKTMNVQFITQTAPFKVEMSRSIGLELLGDKPEVKRVSISSSSSKSESVFVDKAEPTVLPQQELAEESTGYVSFMDTDGTFYVQLASEEEKLGEITEALQKEYGESGGERFFGLAVDMLCCAKFTEDDAWYRAVVLSIDDDQIMVRFVDYGNTDVVTIEKVAVLTSDNMSTPALAYPCCLAGVEAWTEYLVGELEDVTKDQTLTLLKKTQTENKFEVDLSLEDGKSVFDLLKQDIQQAKESAEGGFKYTHLTAGTKIQVYVSHVDSNLNFWVQTVADETSLAEVGVAISEGYEKPVLQKSGDTKESEEKTLSEQAKETANLKNSEEVKDSEEVKESEDAKECEDAKESENVKESEDLKESEDAKESEDVKESEETEDADKVKESTKEEEGDEKKSEDSQKAEDTKEWLKEGAAVVAKYAEDEHWYRGKVLSVGEENCKVHFVDYGNADDVSKKDIYAIKADHVKLSAQAVSCRLDRLVLVEGKEDAAMDALFEATNEAALTLEVIKKVRGEDVRYSVVLLKGSEDIRDKMVADGFCTLLPEEKQEVEEETVEEVVEAEAERLIKCSKDNVLTEPECETPSPFPSLDLQEGQRISVHILHTVNPSEFYVQPESSKHGLDEMMETMFEFYNDLAEGDMVIAEPKPGQACACVYGEDEFWYRAKVCWVKENMCRILYVDYGNRDTVACSVIRQLPEQFTKLPAQTVKCSLAGVRSKEDSWSTEAITLFEEKTSDRTLIMDILTVEEDGRCVVHLLHMGLDINKLLLEKNLGVDAATPIAISRKVKRIFSDSSDMATPQKLNFQSAEGVAEREDEEEVTDKLKSVSVDLDIGERYKLYTSYVMKPDSFYCQLSSSPPVLQKLLEQFQAAYTDKAQAVEAPEVGQLGVARFPEDGQYFRAKLISIDVSEARVFLVDYGRIEDITITDFLILKEEFMDIPSQAFMCNLSEIEYEGEDWSEECCSRFKELVEEKELEAKILSQLSNKCVDVELFNDGKSIGQVLVEEKLAVVKEEDVEEITKKIESLIDPIANTEFINMTEKKIQTTKHEDGFEYLELANEKDYCIEIGHDSVLDQFILNLTGVTKQVEGMMKEIADYVNNNTPETEWEPTVGKPCLVKKGSDPRWFRGKILSVEEEAEESYKVYLVDYREMTRCSRDCVRKLPSKFLEVPVNGFKCQLADVAPVDGTWSQEAITHFNDFTTDSYLEAFLVSQSEEGVHYVRLHDAEDLGAATINRQLVDLGCAVTLPGSLVEMELQIEHASKDTSILEEMEQSFHDVSYLRENSLGDDDSEKEESDGQSFNTTGHSLLDQTADLTRGPDATLELVGDTSTVDEDRDLETPRPESAREICSDVVTDLVGHSQNRSEADKRAICQDIVEDLVMSNKESSVSEDICRAVVEDVVTESQESAEKGKLSTEKYSEAEENASRVMLEEEKPESESKEDAAESNQLGNRVEQEVSLSAQSESRVEACHEEGTESDAQDVQDDSPECEKDEFYEADDGEPSNTENNGDGQPSKDNNNSASGHSKAEDGASSEALSDLKAETEEDKKSTDSGLKADSANHSDSRMDSDKVEADAGLGDVSKSPEKVCDSEKVEADCDETSVGEGQEEAEQEADANSEQTGKTLASHLAEEDH